MPKNVLGVIQEFFCHSIDSGSTSTIDLMTFLKTVLPKNIWMVTKTILDITQQISSIRWTII